MFFSISFRVLRAFGFFDSDPAVSLGLELWVSMLSVVTENKAIDLFLAYLLFGVSVLNVSRGRSLGFSHLGLSENSERSDSSKMGVKFFDFFPIRSVSYENVGCLLISCTSS